MMVSATKSANTIIAIDTVRRGIAAAAMLLYATWRYRLEVPRHENEAQFTDDDMFIPPTGWSEWMSIGSPVTPNSLN